MASAAPRTIKIENHDGSSTIVGNIPATAKITFGPVSPGGKGYSSENVLRIYTSASNQLAVFRNVASFRDQALTVQVEEVEVDERVKETHGPDGSQRSAKRSVQRRYVDDD